MAASLYARPVGKPKPTSPYVGQVGKASVKPTARPTVTIVVTRVRP